MSNKNENEIHVGPEWERVSLHQATGTIDRVDRLKIDGGWLYRSLHRGVYNAWSAAMTFVPTEDSRER